MVLFVQNCKNSPNFERLAAQKSKTKDLFYISPKKVENIIVIFCQTKNYSPIQSVFITSKQNPLLETRSVQNKRLEKKYFKQKIQ